MRGGQHVIRRRDSRAEFGIDKVEKIQHIGLITFSGPLVTLRFPAITFRVQAP